MTRIILGASGVFIVALAGFLFWVPWHAKRTARAATNEFGAALVAHDPLAGPSGTAEYVNGIPNHFGRVTSARVISAWNDTGGSRDRPVTDTLIQTASGPAVIELKFAGSFDGAKSVRWVDELRPTEVRKGALTDPEFNALARAFHDRGDMPAGINELTAEEPQPAPTPFAVPTPPAVKIPKITLPEGVKPSKQLECVQNAGGDIDELTRCASIR